MGNSTNGNADCNYGKIYNIIIKKMALLAQQVKMYKNII